jgi:hypothetical protein
LKNPASKKSIESAKTLLKEIEFLREEQKVDMAKDKKVISNDKIKKVTFEISKETKFETNEIAARSNSFYIVEERDGTPINW